MEHASRMQPTHGLLSDWAINIIEDSVENMGRSCQTVHAPFLCSVKMLY